MKKNLDGVFSMDDDFVQVLHPCKSVAHLASWICNIYIYWKFGVGNIEDVERGAELCFSGPLPLRGPLTSASRTLHLRPNLVFRGRFADPSHRQILFLNDQIEDAERGAELSFSGPLRGPPSRPLRGPCIIVKFCF